jgi:hypothetical protein
MTDETAAIKMSVPADPSAAPSDRIEAVVPHPNISAPLPRGVSYLHHFEIELVSCGRRLWAVASAEGQKIMAEARAEKAKMLDLVAGIRHQFTPPPPEAALAVAPTPPPPPAEIQEKDAADNLVFDEKGRPRMIRNPDLT